MNTSVKKKILILLFFPFCLQLAAQNVEYSVAKDIATNFLSVKKGNANLVVSSEHISRNAGGEALLYIFNFEGGGFVIVSADKNVSPVLAYSPVNSFLMDGRNPAAEDMVDVYAQGIAYAKEVKMEPAPALKNTWDKAEMGDFSVKSQKSGDVVGPLMTSQWNQNKYYNALCPDVANALSGYDDRVPNGCVALAMAQIMYYHRYPYSGVGKYSYNATGFGTQTADFANANYNYEAMSDEATEYSNAIASLCYHAGVSVDMGYKADGSGAQSNKVMGALNYRFEYKLPELKQKQFFEAQWDSLLKTDLDRGLPIYYSAMRKTPPGDPDARHAFVCDGYDDTGADCMFHFNFGWGGYKDGFYTLSTISDNANPAQAYIHENAMISGIEPKTPTIKTTGADTLTATYGSFSDGSSPRVHYENNADRSWLISPQNGRNVTKITLNISYFETEESQDVVRIYADNMASPVTLVAELSGNIADSTIVINATEAFVTFTSDGSGTARGFKFTYTSNITSETDCRKTELTPSSPDVLKTSTGTIDPTDGAKYDDGNTCYWALKPEGAAEKYVGITFTRFDLAEGDYVELNKWDGIVGPVNSKFPTHKGYRLTKDNIELNREYAIQSVAASIRFRTDNNLHGTGFTLNWRVIPDPGVKEVHAGIENISVYPNPASDKVKIQIETLQPETIQLNLYDVFGRILSNSSIFEASQQQFEYDLDVNTLANGVYMLQITTSKGQIMRKIVKK